MIATQIHQWAAFKQQPFAANTHDVRQKDERHGHDLSLGDEGLAVAHHGFQRAQVGMRLGRHRIPTAVQSSLLTLVWQGFIHTTLDMKSLIG